MQISDTGRKMLAKQEKLAREYKYKPIPKTFFQDVRAEWEEALPEWCKQEGEEEYLYSTNNTLIARGYTRIVVGDYGAFVELSPSQANKDVFIIAPGQAYRIENPNYSSNIRIYEQKRPVDYADYKPGMYYASVYEVFPQTAKEQAQNNLL